MLRFIVRGRATYIHEMTSWPFLQAVMEGSDNSRSARACAAKGLCFPLERLIITIPGFYHGHHGTWLMLRSSAQSACIPLAFTSVPFMAIDLLPNGGRSMIEATSQALPFWVEELEALRAPAESIQALLNRTETPRQHVNDQRSSCCSLTSSFHYVWSPSTN